MKQLVKILDDIQKGESEHLKNLLSAQKLYNKNKDQFKSEFITVLQRVLIASQHDASIDRLISFISKFTSKQGENDEFVDFMFRYLASTTRVLNKTVRYLFLLHLFHFILFMFHYSFSFFSFFPPYFPQT